MDVRALTVGPVAENSYLIRTDASAERALLIDPGDEPDRLIAAVDEMGVTVEAILLTHTHFDHIGAVAPLARHTGAPVYCPRDEAFVLLDIMRFVPWPGFGPFENWKADVELIGGEKLELAGFEIDVILTPGHSPAHVTYSIPAEQAMLSGDVLFEGSIGRTDLPGGDTATLMASIADLLDRLPDETQVLPGHMGPTTLGRERASNPFLRELAAKR